MNEGLVILFLVAIDVEELLGRVNVAGAMEVCDCQLEYEYMRSRGVTSAPKTV